jgi:pimeloyl-ACP methyl ester carboxylesterase
MAASTSWPAPICRAAFAAAFAADLPDELARFMADSQLPWGVDALGGQGSQPAWRTKPSWYLVATDDHMIPPPAQRAMAERAGCTVSQVSASHSLYVSQPAATADLIKQTAHGTAGTDPAEQGPPGREHSNALPLPGVPPRAQPETI